MTPSLQLSLEVSVYDTFVPFSHRLCSTEPLAGWIATHVNHCLHLLTGAASQAMLHCLKQMHNSDRSRLERGQVLYRLQAVHVEEAAVNELHHIPTECTPPQRLNDSCDSLRLQLHTMPLEAVFLDQHEMVPFQPGMKLQGQRTKLRDLLQVC